MNQKVLCVFLMQIQTIIFTIMLSYSSRFLVTHPLSQKQIFGIYVTSPHTSAIKSCFPSTHLQIEITHQEKSMKDI